MSYCSHIRRVYIENCRIRISRHNSSTPYVLEEEEFDAPLWNTSILREPGGYAGSSMFTVNYQEQLGSFTVTQDNLIEFYVAGVLTPYVDAEDLISKIRVEQAACSLP